jgi:CheY-like chemotaxis protein
MARVLVAEDDAEMLRLVVEALRKDGHNVMAVPDGGWLFVKLAEACRRTPWFSEIDCIVSDVRMPTCDGLDLLERLGDASRSVPIILMTAFGDDEVRARAERLGALLIEKPLSLEALRRAVSRVAR